MKILYFAALLLAITNITNAKTVVINMQVANDIGTEVGTITATDTKYGLLLTPNLSKSTPTLAPGTTRKWGRVDAYDLWCNSSKSKKLTLCL